MSIPNPPAARPVRQRFKLRLLRVLLSLEEEGTVSRAAERLCISAAAVSKAKMEIESEIGGLVFARAGGRMQPTELGRQVIQSARRVFAELENLSGEIQAFREGLRGSLTVGVRTIAAHSFIAEVTSAFAREHPALSIRLLDADFPFLLDRLLKGEIQLMFGRLDSAVLPTEVEGRMMLSDPNVVIGSPGHPYKKVRRPPWRDLINQRWCLTPGGFSGRISREHLKVHLAGEGLQLPAQVIEANSLLMQIALFETDDFLSIAPMLVARQLEQRRLACILDLPPIGPVDPVFLMWSGNIPLSSAARRFRDHIIARLDERPVTLSFDAPPAARGRRRRS